MAVSPEQIFDVVDYQVAESAPGERVALGLRLFLRDGTARTFVLPGEIAVGIATEIARRLPTLAERPDPASH